LRLVCGAALEDEPAVAISAIDEAQGVVDHIINARMS